VCWRWLERDRDFYEFPQDKKVKLVGVEAGGRGLALASTLLGSPGDARSASRYLFILVAR